jgi:hypothetical protein
VIADELDSLQQKFNQGRGISHIKSVITLLRHGDVEGAKRILSWDHDKTRSYPEIIAYLKQKELIPQTLV